MKQYFLYECKKKAPALAAITVIALLIALTFSNYYHDIMAIQTGALCVIAVLLPAYLFSDFYSKKGSDFFFSLPLTKEKLIIVKILVGLTFIFVSYTIIFLGSSFKMYAHQYNDHVTIGLNPLWLYLTNLALSIPLFGYSTFAFTRANNVLDGFVHLVAYTFLVFFVLMFVYTFLDKTELISLGDAYQFISFETLDRNTVLWQAKIGLTDRTILDNLDEHYAQYTYERLMKQATLDATDIWAIVVQSVLGLGGLFGTIFSVRYQKTEDLGGISTSWFSYKTLIPIYLTLSLAIACSESFEELIVVILLAGGYFGYCLYSRSFVIGKKRAIALVSCIVVGLVLAYVMNYTYFGMHPYDPAASLFS